MSSLTVSLKKVGSALRAQDKAAILDKSRQYRTQGMTPNEAATEAIDDQLALVRGLIEAAVARMDALQTTEPASSATAPPPRVAHDFELALRIDGTLVVRGEKQAVTDLLRAHGITHIMPFHDGVLVGKSMAGQAFDLLSA